ncbi:tetratricopeptide repeat protein [Niabella drilacis]|uniref:Tetratricopeptide repeat-containing protein n=1 Tax=Niabella drilacis (strain DSM 25811 / CCM 8410 / CCUG 62505 / LMG 26954 / E90) TaxID=1285928 RepID=A0A1G6WF89_NIADE|nr:tetratricopeptide repeat protein [Niabella drilacis]SDD64459.1 Tetratricopeptide repeat-containing protein [Niabella drilacis]
MNRIEKLEALLRENGDDGFLNHALALEYVKAGDDGKAAALFKSILEKDPDYVGSYYHLGKLQERCGDEPGAIAVYKKGMEIAQKLGEQHAYNELRAACEYLEF